MSEDHLGCDAVVNLLLFSHRNRRTVRITSAVAPAWSKRFREAEVETYGYLRCMLAFHKDQVRGQNFRRYESASVVNARVEEAETGKTDEEG